MNKSAELSIDVFVLSFNRAFYLRQALRSVLEQSRKPKRVVILDNGSDEDVKRKVLDLLGLGISWEGTDVTHSSLWNIQRAFDDARLKYVYVMHDDDRLCPNFLETQVEFLEKHMMATAVACGAHVIDSDGNRVGRLTGLETNKEVRWFNSSADVAVLYSKRGFLPFPSVIYRTSSTKRVKIRTEYGKVADVVLLCELAGLGPIAYRNIELLEYRLHAAQDSAKFPDDVLLKLDAYLIWKGSSNLLLTSAIFKNIRRFWTERYLNRWIFSVKQEWSLGSAIDGVRLFNKPYFSLEFAVRYVLNLLIGRVQRSISASSKTKKSWSVVC